MRASTARSCLTLLALIAGAACAEKAPGADSANDSAAPSPVSSPSDSAPGAVGASPSAAAPKPNTGDSAGSPIVAGRPACARPVTVTYYARGGVANEFIVTFGGMNGANADAVTDSLARRHGFTPTHRYEGAFSGFSAKIPLATLEAIRCEPAVTRISQVVVGSIGTVPPPDVRR